MTIDKARPPRVEAAQTFTSRIRFASGRRPPLEERLTSIKEQWET